MKNLARNPVGALVAATLIVGALLPLPLFAQSPDSAYVDFGKLTPPDKGGEFVEVNVNSNLIAMVTRMAKTQDAEVAEIIGGLKQIHVNVVSLDDKNRDEVTQRIKQIRTDLDGKTWGRVVTVINGDDDVVVQVKTHDDKTVEGIAVTILTGDHQAVLVNVIGEINPEKLAMLGERFDIEPLKKLKIGKKNS